jgi:Na+-transporting NADH:ubiquinone oxidoreductase subunit A
MPHINIKKGHDIRISGKPDKNIASLNNPKTLAILPTDFKGVKPKLIVKEGDKVKIGSSLFFDKNNPDIKWASPGAGKIKNIEYGPRRVIQKIEILLSDNQENIEHKKYKRTDIANLGRKQVLSSILEANIFPIFRQRPFNIIPDPAISPRDIFVSAVDTSPLGVDLDMVMVDEVENFQAGMDVLNILTDGKVYLTTKPGSVLSSIQNVELNTISGPHPAGNIGIQIHHISHLKPGDSIWTVNSQDVLTLGKLFLSGFYDPSKVITLGGPCVSDPGHFRITQGATMASIIGDRLNKEDSRIISGDVLTGRGSSLEDYISYYDCTISIISNEIKREFIGMLNPGSSSSRYSLTPVFLSFSKMLFPFNTSQNGNHRAIVPINTWESVLPMDILPNELYRSILAEDVDEMEKLGLIECDDEDFALCSFACPSKTDVGGVIRKGLDMLQAEV